MTALGQALATDGLWLLALAAALAGLVRGFSGFGTAMIYLPLAAQVLPPVWVLVTLITIDLFGPIPAIPRALRDGHPRDVARLGAGALVGLPIGLAVLLALPPDIFRYGISILTIALLITLISGFRYRGIVTKPLIYLTGLLGGIGGGAVGLTGPPVILLYMARPLPAKVIRANTLLYLVLADILLAFLFAWRGLLELQPILIGVLLIPLYLAMVWLGTAIFDPGRGSVYRLVAYAIIAVSALSGLPFWDQ